MKLRTRNKAEKQGRRMASSCAGLWESIHSFAVSCFPLSLFFLMPPITPHPASLTRTRSHAHPRINPRTHASTHHVTRTMLLAHTTFITLLHPPPPSFLTIWHFLSALIPRVRASTHHATRTHRTHPHACMRTVHTCLCDTHISSLFSYLAKNL